MDKNQNSIELNRGLVSIIVPVFNGQRFIAQALESAFNQTYTNIEVVVVDDGSTDKTAEIAQSFSHIKYHHQENQGVAAARNAAVEMSVGEYVCFLDSDDFYLDHKIERQLVYLKDHPEADCCVVQLRNFVEEGYVINPELENYFVSRELINLSSIFMKRSTFEKVGKFNTTYKTGSDFEWVTRAREIGLNIGILEEVLMERRIHDTNISVVGQAEDKAVRFRIIRESLARRREQESKNG